MHCMCIIACLLSACAHGRGLLGEHFRGQGPMAIPLCWALTHAAQPRPVHHAATPPGYVFPAVLTILLVHTVAAFQAQPLAAAAGPPEFVMYIDPKCLTPLEIQMSLPSYMHTGEDGASAWFLPTTEFDADGRLTSIKIWRCALFLLLPRPLNRCVMLRHATNPSFSVAPSFFLCRPAHQS